MSTRRILNILSIIALAVLGSLFYSEPALAQCAMCRAAVTGSRTFVRNMNLAVLVLLLPPVSIFCTIFIVAIRNRKG